MIHGEGEIWYNIVMTKARIVGGEKENCARLSNQGGFSLFSFRGDTIRFATPRSLVRYLRVKQWDDGYLEVEADYGKGAEEDYIDMRPILDNLYYDTDEFLKPIKKVEVAYG